LIVTSTGPAEPPALVAEQEYIVAAWSAVMFWFTQPVFSSELGDCGSPTLQVRLTLLLYQPFVPLGEAGLSV
jgi:hypothetical protein